MSGRVDTVDRTVVPAPGPPPDIRLPEFAHARLGNGLEVYAAERPGLPEVSLRLILEAGAASRPREDAGLAALTGRLLTEGAGGRSAMEMAEWQDRMGAAFAVSVGPDVALASLHSLSETLDDALDLLATAVTAPDFPPDEVLRVRQERLDEIERRRDDPAEVAGEALLGAVYGPHPYGALAGGTPGAVARIEPEAVRAFHRERYVAGAATLVACGDVAADDFIRRVEKRLGEWPGGGSAAEPPATPGAAVEAGRVLIVDRPGSPQSEIRIGAIGAPRGSEDDPRIEVANAILGGLFNSRVNMNLREDKGWTYGARTSFLARRRAGPFVARAAVETGVTAAAFDELVAEIRGLARRPPDEEELRLARNALTRSLPRQFETSAQITRRFSHLITYRLPLDFWEGYRERIEAVDRAAVVDVVERYLAPERLVFVAVGDAAAHEEALARLGQVGRWELS
ncbi:MAG: M16 family metallopeptidase [Gemmatimonadota bacterium]